MVDVFSAFFKANCQPKNYGNDPGIEILSSLNPISRKELANFITCFGADMINRYLLTKLESRVAFKITKILSTSLITNTQQAMDYLESKEKINRKVSKMVTKQDPFEFSYQARIKIDQQLDEDTGSEGDLPVLSRPVPKTTYESPAELENLKKIYKQNQLDLMQKIEEGKSLIPSCAKIPGKEAIYKNPELVSENTEGTKPTVIQRCPSPKYLNVDKTYRKNYACIYRKVNTIQREENSFLERLNRLAVGERSDDDHKRYVVNKYLEYIEGQEALLKKIKRMNRRTRLNILKRKSEIRQANKKEADVIKEIVRNLSFINRSLNFPF